MDLFPGGIPFIHKDKYKSEYNTMTFLLIAEYPLARKRGAIGLFFAAQAWLVLQHSISIERHSKNRPVSAAPQTLF